ncbi:catechol 2,3-dioxygenase-like lactoylglutathione lyase family enzyme [Flavobacteriaceae bacterium MAR_2010_105]|nr:catechol 2,3-dioxygenase-like lactoylglutathione lyase family enzyme [Flavobacteriaceae bacterium MAR_2010_105]
MKKLIIILCLILSSKSVMAQSTTEISMIFNHVSLSVSDVDVSFDFYKTMFQLEEIVNRTKVDGIRWFSLSEGKELHLISVVPGDILLNKAVHFALTTSTFDVFVNNLEEKEMNYTSWSGEVNTVTIRPDGVKQVYVQDPDGYWIEINSVAQN